MGAAAGAAASLAHRHPFVPGVRLDPSVGAGEDESFVIIVEPVDDVRWRAVRVPAFGYDADTTRVANVRALEYEPVSDVTNHGCLPLVLRYGMRSGAEELQAQAHKVRIWRP